MKIRKARLTDAAVIADFNARLAWETEQLRLRLQHRPPGRPRLAERSATKGTYFVAEQDGVVVGQLANHLRVERLAQREFLVDSKRVCRRRVAPGGVFRALFGHVQKLAKSRRDVCGLRLYVEKNNRRAHRAYERLGMKPTHYEIYETRFR